MGSSPEIYQNNSPLNSHRFRILVDPPWSPLARWVTFYSCFRHHLTPIQPRTLYPKQESTRLIKLYTELYSAVMDFPKLHHSFGNSIGSTLDYSGLVLFKMPIFEPKSNFLKISKANMVIES